MSELGRFTFKAEEADVGVRLDRLLVQKFPDRTRHYLQKIIAEGCVVVRNKKAKASTLLRVGDTVTVAFPPLKEIAIQGRDLPLDIVYEDKNVLIINKAPGMVVHPGTGDSHMEDSLVNAVLYHCKSDLSGISGSLRPGIVHRLDKDTSGLLIVAKNDLAHQFLTEQFKNRTIEKTYYALVVGHLEPMQGTIEAPIGRDHSNRKRMAIASEKEGRMAITKYKVLRYLGDYSFLEITLITGRTHQIRVHFASIDFPLVGDPLYGKPKVNAYFEKEYGLTRIFLHAGKMALVLPPLVKSSKVSTKATKKSEFIVALPLDLQSVLDRMKA